MEITGGLFIVLMSRILVQGTVIDPKAADASSKIHYHCLYSKQPIRLKNPFIPSEFQNFSFHNMIWDKSNTLGEPEGLLEVTRTHTEILHPDVSVFEFWGLQINNIRPETSGTYTAVLRRYDTVGEDAEVQITIKVVVPPLLNTSLTLIGWKNNDQSVTLYCGPILSLGDPAVAILFKDGSGGVLHTVKKLDRGYATINHKGKQSEVVCEVDSSIATTCMNDISNWRATWRNSEASRSMFRLCTGLLVLMAAVVVVYG